MTTQQMGPHLFEIGNGLGLAQLAKSWLRLFPGLIRRLNDPRAHVLRVLVGAEIPDAELVGCEVK